MKRVVVYIKETVSAKQECLKVPIPNVVISLGAFVVAILYSEFTFEGLRMTEKSRISRLFEVLDGI